MDQNNNDNIINKNFPKEISEKVIAMIDIPEIRERLKKEGSFEKKYGPFAAGQEAMCALYILSDDKTRETGESSNAKLITNNDGTCYINFVISTKKTSLTDKEKEEIASHNKMWFGQVEEKPAAITSSSPSSEIVLSEAELQHMARISSKLNGEDPDKLSPEAKEKYIERLREMMKPMGTSSTWPPLASEIKITEEPELSDNTKKMVEDAIKRNPENSQMEESAPWKTIKMGDKVIEPKLSGESRKIVEDAIKSNLESLKKGYIEYDDLSKYISSHPSGYGTSEFSDLMLLNSDLDRSIDEVNDILNHMEEAKKTDGEKSLQDLRDNASNTHDESTDTGVINETTGEYSDYSNTQPTNDNNVTPSDYFDDTNPRRGGK